MKISKIRVFDKKVIQSSFTPFLKPDEINGMIIGNDLDSLASACFLKTLFGWDIVGFYDYRSLWFSNDIPVNQFLSNLKNSKYIAVDIDIYRNYLPSIGHHILTLNTKDILPQHNNSLNPNLIQNTSHMNFRNKYPLGTIHFLMWLFNDYPCMTRLGELILWLVDSSFINAQSHRYKNNVKQWLDEFVTNRILLNSLDEVDSLEFEDDMLSVAFPVLEKTGLGRGKGQVKSKYLKLQGFQCQWNDPNSARNNILKLFNVIENNLGLSVPEIPTRFHCLQGKRSILNFSENDLLNKDFLRTFLAENKVFSYVISNKYTINYTTNIDYK